METTIFKKYYMFKCSPISTHYRPAMPIGNRKICFRGLSLVLSQLKKYRTSGNLKFNNLGIFQSLTFRILLEKNPYNFS